MKIGLTTRFAKAVKHDGQCGNSHKKAIEIFKHNGDKLNC